MKLGLIKSDFPNERRLPLLPKDIHKFENVIFIESGFGSDLDIDDAAYRNAGCTILSRPEIFAECDAIFSLKIIQPTDYKLIRPNQIIIGWTHPLGSGKDFMKTQAIPKNLYVLDLDNRRPTMFYQGKSYPSKIIPRNYIYQNSFYAGYAGTLHALLNYGLLPDNDNSVAILGAGNTAQGAFHAVSKMTPTVRMFTRRTMPEFKEHLPEYSIVINGIEVGDEAEPIMTLAEQAQLKKGSLIIDIAADAGNAIEGNHFTTVDQPIYQENGLYYYTLPNTPIFAYRNISKVLSKQFSHYIFKEDLTRLIDEINE
ncbi:N(5)-(carboxyethyl)ornithine synthase [Enterococcus alishanensis]